MVSPLFMTVLLFLFCFYHEDDSPRPVRATEDPLSHHVLEKLGRGPRQAVRTCMQPCTRQLHMDVTNVKHYCVFSSFSEQQRAQQLVHVRTQVLLYLFTLGKEM